MRNSCFRYAILVLLFMCECICFVFHQITHGFKDAADIREPAIPLAARSVSQGDCPAQSAWLVTIKSKELEFLFSCFFFSPYNFQLREESDYPSALFSLYSKSIILEAFLTPLKHFELWPLTQIPTSVRAVFPGEHCIPNRFNPFHWVNRAKSEKGTDTWFLYLLCQYWSHHTSMCFQLKPIHRS